MQRSENCAGLLTAFSKAQAKFTSVKKEAVANMGVGGKRKYATLDDILAMARPILNEMELSVMQFVENDETDISRIKVTTQIAYKDDEWISSTFSLPPDRQGGIQGSGSAITYAKRYSLSAILGISCDDDDDGEAAMQAMRKQQQPPKQDNLPNLRVELGKILIAKGINSKEDMAKAISQYLGKEIKSSYDLTESELTTLIKTLKEEK